MIRSSMRRYHTYSPHRALVGALCEGSSMRTCRYAKSSDRSSMRRELYAALQGILLTNQYRGPADNLYRFLDKSASLFI